MLMVGIAENNSRLREGLIMRMQRALRENPDAEIMIIVPRQLTLFTERMVLSEGQMKGTFRVKVQNVEGLCRRIFSSAGFPSGVRVDDRGRVMLVRRSIRACDSLTVYKGADNNSGFSKACAKQLEAFAQGQVQPEDLYSCAAESGGLLQMKLNDLAGIMEHYNQLREGQYLDGETEILEAVARIQQTDFAAKTLFFFFGFDALPVIFMRMMVELAKYTRVQLFFPMTPDPSSPEMDVYRPMEDMLERLRTMAEDAQVRYFQTAAYEGNEPRDEIHFLSHQLFSSVKETWTGEKGSVHFLAARDVRQECMYIAARARLCAMEGMRYRDIQVLADGLEEYRQVLLDAFDLFEVPAFLATKRPSSHMAPAECLLTALRIIDRGYPQEDVFALMRTGCTDLENAETEHLMNYAIRYGIDRRHWTRSFTRGTEEEILEMEPLRRRLIEPVNQLREALRSGKTLKDQMIAVFGYLTEMHVYEHSLELQKTLKENGMLEEAGELSQSWNKIIGALDQMVALMGEGRLNLRELTLTLTESLDAEVIRTLPQSEDAVYVQDLGNVLMQSPRVLFVIGLSDHVTSDGSGLLSEYQRNSVAEFTRSYLGPSETDLARKRRYVLKAGIAMTRDAVYLSCPLSGQDGSPQRMGYSILQARDITNEEWTAEECVQRVLACAPGSALINAGRVMEAERTSMLPDPLDRRVERSLNAVRDRMPRIDMKLRLLENLRYRETMVETLNPEHAAELYRGLNAQSTTKLAKFAGCPFSYFCAYGLELRKVEPFRFNNAMRGDFLHEAIREFLNTSRSDITVLEPEEAQRRMSKIADMLLKGMEVGTPMEDSFAARGEARSMRATALMCARVLTAHMRDSKFEIRALEKDFGHGEGAKEILGGDTVLEGRIDRVDDWQNGDAVRIIDYKTGGRDLDLTGVYYGQDMQLFIYLDAVLQEYRQARCAGVYYFGMNEGIVKTTSLEPEEVEKERVKDTRMRGLIPSDMELLRMQTPEPENVFHAQINKDGTFSKNTQCASEEQFRQIVRHSMRKVEEQLDGIRNGNVKIEPVESKNRSACTYCEYRPACMLDAKLDAKRVRRIKNMKFEEIMDKIAKEESEELEKNNT